MSRPAIPDVPACWSWDLPSLPQSNCITSLRGWQQDRCAICAHYAPEYLGLYEDHCHRTGSTRGYLCPRCNTLEGTSPAPVFELYRQRHPTQLLGLVLRRGRYRDFLRDQAEKDFQRAVYAAWYRTSPGGYAKDRHYADLNHAAGVPWPDPDLPDWTPLMRAVHRVGLTPDELALIAEKRHLAAMGIQWRPYDEVRDNPMRAADSPAGAR